MTVSVVYAPTAEEQVQLTVAFEPGLTVRLAIERSGLLRQFPDLNLLEVKVGVYSELVTLEHIVAESDRVEVYRPLIIDPKSARRLRAERRS